MFGVDFIAHKITYTTWVVSDSRFAHKLKRCNQYIFIRMGSRPCNISKGGEHVILPKDNWPRNAFQVWRHVERSLEPIC